MLIMQRRHQFPTDNLKSARPPPVPPRPDKSLVADALAKTRKHPEYQNSFFPDKQKPRDPAQPPEPVTNVSPKLNGLSRVKSFIRDVISDKKSNEEKKQQNGNTSPKNTQAKNSKDDQKSQLPVSSAFKIQNGKKVKTPGKVEDPPKKSLVRSLSSSLKSDHKNLIFNGDKPKELPRVSKSNSFAEKALPMRRAPPPPISPKPPKKQLEKMTIPLTNSQLITKLSASCEELNRTVERPIVYQSKLPKISNTIERITAKNVEQSVPLAVIDQNSPVATDPIAVETDNMFIDNIIPSVNTAPSSDCKKVVSTVDDTNIGDYVTRKLIAEILESKKPEKALQKEINSFDTDRREATKNKTTILLNGDDSSPKKVKTDLDTVDREKRLNDISNHELLISELESMRRDAYGKRPDQFDDVTPSSPGSQASESLGISRQSSVQSFSLGSISNNDDCDMCLADDVSFMIPSDLACRMQEQFSAGQQMSALRGLPPLPKSLSSFGETIQRVSVSTAGSEDDSQPPAVLSDDVAARLALNGPSVDRDALRRPPTTLDTQLALLKREMVGLRQLDLSLLSQLWTLNEAIHDWKQEVEQRRTSSSSARLRPAPPPPPLSPESSSEERSSRSGPSVEYVSS